MRNATVIFDFDGTLANTYILLKDMLNRYAPVFIGRQVSEEEITEARNMSIREILFKYKISPLKILRYGNDIRSYIKNKLDLIRVYPGIREALEELNQDGAKLFVVTHNSRDNVDSWLKLNKLNMIRNIYSENSLFGKASAIIKMIKQEKLTDVSRIYYVGDELRDIDAARKAGIKIISVTWGFNSYEALKRYQPDMLVNSPAEIVEYVKDS